ncbi:hypothetical protein Q3G72_014674 [Acer saccharum]|nr:hypothetical protein Q3G72_014674 [Acer saccharum]
MKSTYTFAPVKGPTRVMMILIWTRITAFSRRLMRSSRNSPPERNPKSRCSSTVKEQEEMKENVDDFELVHKIIES